MSHQLSNSNLDRVQENRKQFKDWVNFKAMKFRVSHTNIYSGLPRTIAIEIMISLKDNSLVYIDLY